MELIAVNLTGKLREVTYLNRSYYVVPVRMIVPGVLNGNKGRLYYPIEEITKNPNDWNGIPLVVGHPTSGNKPISARDPKVIEKYGIGYVFNTIATSYLDAEAWFDVERTRKIDARIVQWLRDGKRIEISTGLYPQITPAIPGAVDNQGREYDYIASNYRPDHLAVLTDGVGACSIADGCGVLVNENGSILMSKKGIWQKLGEVLGITSNQLSHSDIRQSLQDQLTARFAPPQPASSSGYSLASSCYITDVYDKFVVYQMNGENYKLSYTTDLRTDDVTLSSGEPVEVTRVTTYKPVTNSGDEWFSESDLTTNPYANEHAARVEDPGKFKNDSFRRKEVKPGISIILGKKPDSDSMEVQAYRFDAEKFTAEEAKKWLKDHKIDYVSFEAAKKQTNNSLEDSPIVANYLSQLGDTMPLTPEQRKPIVDGLVANCNCTNNVPWKGKNVDVLNALTDETLVMYDQWRKSLEVPVAPAITQPQQPATNQHNGNFFVDAVGNRYILNPTTNQLVQVNGMNTQQGQTQPANNQQPPVQSAQVPPPNPVPGPQGKPKTVQEWLAQAPPEAQSVWNSAQEMFNREKTSLIEHLTNNMTGEAKDEAVKIYSAMDVPQLRILSAAMPQKQEEPTPTANWFGSIGAPSSVPVSEEPLLAPTYDFTRKSA